MNNIVLGLDLETTGLDFTTDKIIEVGAVLWSHGSGTPIVMISELIKNADAPPITEEITKLTGITQSMIDVFGVPLESVVTRIKALLPYASAVVAHNGNNFDRPMWEANAGHLAERWIDTSTDPDYPAEITTRKLKYLAAEYGIVNPFSHRAVSDVLTMLSLFSKFDFYQTLENSQQPIVRILANVSFAEKDLAKEVGYRWDGEKRQWYKELKANKLTAELAIPRPFQVQIAAT